MKRSSLLWVGGWFLATRAFSYVFMVLGTFWQRPPERYAFWAGQAADGSWYQQVPSRWLDVFGRWDSMYYVDLATNGYPPPLTDGEYLYNAAFFPLVPSLMRGLCELVPALTPFLAGIIISNVMFFIALVYVQRLVELDGPQYGSPRQGDHRVQGCGKVIDNAHSRAARAQSRAASPRFDKLTVNGWLALGGLCPWPCRRVQPEPVEGLSTPLEASGVGHPLLGTCPHDSGRAAVMSLLLFPVSGFFCVVYSEATALALTVLALYAVRTRRPALAALACALGLWARPTGWVTCVAVLLELMTVAQDGGLRRRFALRWRLLWMLVPALGFAGVLVLFRATVGDPLLFLRVQAGWGRSTGFPLSSLLDTGRSLDHHLFALLGLGFFALAVAQRMRLSLLVFAAINLLVPLSTGSIQSMPRFVMSNLPLPLAAGQGLATRPRLRACVVGLALVLLAIYSFRWGAGFQPN